MEENEQESGHMRPDRATRAAERAEAEVRPIAGPEPTPEEAEAADDAARALEQDGSAEAVAEHYREMTERGAHQKGEGRLP